MPEIKEWQSPYNSFSSLKGFTYFEQYKQIMDWMEYRTDYLPPPKECKKKNP